MYKAGDQFPLVEEDAVSDSNDARQIEVGVCLSVVVCVWRVCVV